MDHRLVDPRRDGLLRTAAALARHRISHVHLSHPAAMFVCVGWARLCGRASVLTVHGDLGRFRGWRRTLARAAVRLASVPLLLNDLSWQVASRLNPRARRLSAFIPETETPPLPDTLAAALMAHTRRGATLIASNAFNLAYDGHGREIYGIFELIDWCRRREYLLVVSDPSGNYHRAAQAQLPAARRAHVLFLCGPHSFCAVLAHCTLFVRHTITDGDSLSIHEALGMGKPVWAMSVVPRPAGTLIYTTLDEIDIERSGAPNYRAPEVVAELVHLYRTLSARQT